jgi:four helix bundle protein
MKFSFEDLDVWQLAVEFAERVYIVSKDFPKDEVYGITAQLRRAALSISLNIAEGKGRSSNKEYKQFIFIARGSLYETITLLKMCFKLKFITESIYEGLIADCEKIQSKISGLLNYLKGKTRPQ